MLLASFSLWAAPATGPKTLKPVAVISLSGYDEVLGDIGFVGKLSDNPDLDKGLEALLKLLTKSRGLAGLDKSRPWGGVVQCDGSELSGYGFLPVTDLAELLAAYGTCDGDPDYNPDADLDDSGCIDLADLATLLSNYGYGV